MTRVRRFQRELEAAEDRADQAESNLTLIRAKHRTFVCQIDCIDFCLSPSICNGKVSR